ncbi:Crp/Fnr family transcriptional regulator [Rhodopseudomonas sp. B29]|uniref:Crp/Fnr family transcriptional regulator n=1 Tax=Rhodopseudomonas sp. B29 TaxID=95607 RepID=UPI00034CF3BE|nr:Crp/Fnr family transcriptional regulator [Rhodopseudomonas sp. B29]
MINELTPSRQAIRNRILADLSADDFATLEPLLRRIDFRGRTVLQEANRPVEYVHFIEDGLVSHVAGSRTESVETAMVGCFGYVGVPLILGSSIAPQRAIACMPGSALRIEADELSRLLTERPQIHARMLRYVQALMAQNSQSVLCATKHEINQRLARWLLLAIDRLQSDVLAITHEMLATSMGVRRASITNALLQFEAEGVVQKQRGAIRVIDRAGLEQRACDCYHIVRDAYASAQTAKDGCAHDGHAHDGHHHDGHAHDEARGPDGEVAGTA